MSILHEAFKLAVSTSTVGDKYYFIIQHTCRYLLIAFPQKTLALLLVLLRNFILHFYFHLLKTLLGDATDAGATSCSISYFLPNPKNFLVIL